jgi:DNA-binding LacI/PurR family transcriptional regulator
MKVKTMSTTILQVAEKANVSRMTVSRVMSGKDTVSTETRRRVLKAMQELSYVPSLAARAIRSKDNLRASGSLCCALIFGPDVKNADSFFCDVARAAEWGAAQQGLCLLQSHWQDSFEQSWLRLQSVFSVAGLCGAVLAGQFTADEVRSVQKHVNHIVIVDGPVPGDTPVGSVESDNINGCRLALEHLVARGAKRILVMVGPLDNHYFSKAMISAANDISVRCEYIKIVKTDFTPEMGCNIVREVFKDGKPFDGIFGNDELAIGVLYAFSELGINVPEEVKIVGFDDISHSSFTTPALTTVRIDKSELGREAVKMLIEMFRGQDNSINVKKVIKANLVLRAST